MYRALVKVRSDEQVELSEEEIHHLVRVRRLQPGQMFLGLGTGWVRSFAAVWSGIRADGGAR